MNQEATTLLLMGLAMIALGLSGWLLPYRWNLLRLRGSLARFVAEEKGRWIPRIVGSFAIMGGLATLVMAALVGVAWIGAFGPVVKRHQEQVQRERAAAGSIAVEVLEHDVASGVLTVRGSVRNDGRWRVTGVTVRLDLKSADGTVVGQDWERVVREPESFAPGERRVFDVSTEVAPGYSSFECVVEPMVIEVLEEPTPGPGADPH